MLSHFIWDPVGPHGLYPARLICPWDSLGKNPGVGCHVLLHGIFLTQGSEPCLLYLLHRQVGSLPLMPPGKPYIYDFIIVEVVVNKLSQPLLPRNTAQSLMHMVVATSPSREKDSIE